MKSRLLAAGATLVALAGLWFLGYATRDRPLAQLGRDPSGAYVGSWWFPRGGPYVVGYYSPSGEASLSIDGCMLASGGTLNTAPRGQSNCPAQVGPRLVYEKGAHAVRFTGPPDARLVWLPPGRRGAVEYVPASSLSPDPPETARFHSPGTSRGSAAIVALMLLVAIAGGLAVIRPRIEDRRFLLMAAGVFAFALIIRLLASGAAGQTWDEDEYWSSGRNYITNLLAFDFSPAAWQWNFQHPPVTKYLAGIGALWTDGYAGAHLVFSLLGAGTCALVYAIGKRLYDWRVGLAAGGVAALMPHLIAHSTVVGHETPSVFFWALAVWLALRLRDDTTGFLRQHVWIGIAFGLAVATRFTNLLLGMVLFVTLIAIAPAGIRSFRTALRRALAFALMLAVAAGVFYVLWPNLWLHPIDHLQHAYAKLRLPHLPEPYLGAVTNSPAWHYFFVAVAATTPLLVLLAAIPLAIWRSVNRREIFPNVVLGVFFLLPFAVMRSPVRQDGVRYVLPALIPLCVWAGAGILHLGERLRYAGRTRSIPFLPAGLLLVYLGITCLRIHPYYLDYFAEQAGGPSRVLARKTFEVGWWGEGIDRAIAYVNAHAAPNATITRLVEPTHVTWFRYDLWARLNENPAVPGDWLVVNNTYTTSRRPGWKPPPAFRKAYDVTAQGASLVQVWSRDAAPAPPASQR
jgi:4-amino-4-deoxy-L-arabinose transferase-like glycosyltransferase